MEIDESEIYYKGENDYVFIDENKALACLLNADVCFLNNLKVRNEWTTCVYVIANDVFAWGCADAECISNSDGDENSEIYSLYKLWKENNDWGAIKWLCLKRNEQPQKPIIESMKKDGYWDDTLEKLPPNYYWTRLQEDNNKRFEKFRNLPIEEREIIESAASGLLNGKIQDHPLLLKALNEGCGYFFKPEDKIETSASTWSKWLVNNSKLNK